MASDRVSLMRQLAGRKPVGVGMNAGYWYGYTPPAQLRRAKPAIDRPIMIVPTGMREPPSMPPKMPVWANTNCPPWNCPPFWSVPFSMRFTGCVPQYEIAVSLGCFTVPKDYFLVVKEVSYEALNADQDDVFELEFLVNNQLQAKWEDINQDAVQPNPAERYALAGHYRPMPTQLIADRNSTLCVRSTLRGPISFAGVSPYFPGQPIVTGDCSMNVIVNGWLANLREDLDGGPRPTDLGDMDFSALEDDQSRGGFP